MNGYTFSGWVALIDGQHHPEIFDTQEDAVNNAIAICELSGLDGDITTEFVDQVLSAEQMKQALDPYLDEDHAD